MYRIKGTVSHLIRTALKVVYNEKEWRPGRSLYLVISMGHW
jgi:hypothetical protein